MRTIRVLVLILASLGVVSSVMRATGVFESLSTPGDPPAMSSLDRRSTYLVAALLGIEPESSLARDGEEQNQRFLGKFNRHPVATLLHVLPAALFMILTPLQFSRRIRARHLRWHRRAGRLSLMLAIPIGMSGLWFGLRVPFAGALESTAIALFGGLFLLSAVSGFLAIRRGDRVRHREWMIRMFVLAIGVSNVRLVGVLLAVITREGPDAWFAPSVWIGFSLSAAAGELWIQRTRASHEAEPDGKELAGLPATL